MKKILIFMLVLLTVCQTVLCVGCKEEDVPEINKGYEESDTEFIDNGFSDYKIVISDIADDELLLAKDELIYFVKEITGCSLEVLSDKLATLDKKQKYISIGRNDLFKRSDIKIKEGLGDSGCMISSYGNTVFIVNDGQYDNGTLFGVYEFLNIVFGLEIYTVDCWNYSYNGKVNMPVFDYVRIPDIDKYYSYYMRNDALYQNRLRMTNQFARQNWRFFQHSQPGILKLTTEYLDNPKWINSKNALCYAQEDMYPVFAKNVCNILESDKEHNRVFLGIYDSISQCNCSDCQAMQQKYHTNSAGQMMVFLNYVVDYVIDYFQGKDPERDLEFSTFVYEGVFEPPVYKDANGNYVPDDPAVVPHERLFIQFTPLLLDNTYSLTELQNQSNYETLLGWSSLTDNMESYVYNFYTRGATVTAPTFLSFEENIKVLKENKVKYFFEEGPNLIDNFGELKIYVQSKMCWDTNLKYDDLAHDFCENYFGPAGKTISALFDFTKAYCASNRENMPGACQTSVTTLYSQSFYQEEFLNTQIKMCEKAEEDLEPLKEVDSQKYNEYLWRVRKEEFCARVNRLKIYSASMTDSQINNEVEMIRNWVNNFRFGKDGISPDGGTFSAWFDSLLA